MTSPVPSSEIPACRIGKSRALRLTDMAREFDSHGVTARSSGDDARAALYFSLAQLHRLFIYNKFMDGAEFDGAYDPTTQLESAPDELFVTLADWTVNAPEPWQRASYALGLLRTEGLWQARGLNLPRRHELVRALVESELQAAADALASDIAPRARALEFTSSWRRAARFARSFGLLAMLVPQRSGLLSAAAEFLDDACWWSVGILEVFVDILSGKEPPPDTAQIERALNVLAQAEERVVATKSFQCADALVALRSRLSALAGTPREQRDEARHGAELLLHQVDAQETHWLRAAWLNDAAQLLEQAGDRLRAEEMKQRSVEEMRCSEAKAEMKPVSVSATIRREDLDAHISTLLGSGPLPDRMARMSNHLFVSPLDHPDNPIPSNGGIVSELTTSVTFVDDRVKTTTSPGTDSREDRNRQKHLMIAVNVGHVFVVHAWEHFLVPLMRAPSALLQFIMPDFEEGNRGLWERLSRAVFERDWTVVIHLGAPRAERVVRETFRQIGEPTVARDRFGGGLVEKSFGDLVRGGEESGRLSPALASFLRCTLTEEWGLNIRNRVAHGLIREDECTDLTAMRLVHILLVLRRWSVEIRAQTTASPSET